MSKKGEYNTILNFNPVDASKRVYFEFYLTPPGVFNFPNDFEIAYFGDNEKITQCVTHSMNKNLILLIRFAIIEFDWHNDLEITLVPNEIN